MAGRRTTLGAVLALGCIFGPYFHRLGDVPLIKVDEFWGAQASWEIWRNGRFSLPAFRGHLRQEEKTFFHPPGFYLVNALVVGPLKPSTWSVRLGPTLFALLSFCVLYRTLRRVLAGTPHGPALAIAGVAIAAWNPLTFALSRHARPETWILLLGVSAASLARPGAVSALTSGLLSGYAFFSHYWAWVIPGLIGIHLLSQREGRALGWYLLGFSVFTGATALWITSNWADFAADVRWLRSGMLPDSILGYLEKRFMDQAALAVDRRLACVWLVEAFLLFSLALPGARPVRGRVLGRLILLHVLLLLFPGPSPYYMVSVLYFCSAAIPLTLAQSLSHAAIRAAPGGSSRSRTLAAALVFLILVPASGLAYMIWRDREARYDETFRPLREAVDRADPGGNGVTVGSEIQYLAFWDRPFLLRSNPYLWLVDTTDRFPDTLVRRWKEIGVRFVLTSSLMPLEAGLGPLDPSLNGVLIDHLRSTGRILERVETYFYGEPEHKYRIAQVEVIDLGA